MCSLWKIQKGYEKVEETIEKNEKKIFSVKDELEKINGQTIFEFEKTVDDFEIEKVKAYTVNDENKTVCLLFYDIVSNH